MTLRIGTILSVLLLTLLIAAAPLADPHLVRDRGDTRRLLIVDSQRGNPYDEVREALLQALKRYGYVQGKNLYVKTAFIGNDIKEGERFILSEIGNNYHVIFTGGTAATLSAKSVLHGNTRHNVVFGSATDPVGIGVISDFQSRPSSGFTGVCYPVPVKARLRFVRRLMPRAKVLGLIYADMPQSVSYNRWITDLIRSDPEFRDLKVVFRPVRLVIGEDGDATMAAEAVRHVRELDAKVDAFLKPCDQMGTRRSFSEALYKNSSKPLVGLVRDDVMGHWGATATMYPLHSAIGQQSARMIKEIFEGKKSSDIVPEWPKSFGVAIDLQKARRFGIKVPVEMLRLAGENVVK